MSENENENFDKISGKETSMHRKRISYLQTTPAMILFTIFFSILFLFVFIGEKNPEIFVLSKDTILYINNTINTLEILTIPFIFGCAAAAARILISDLNIIRSSNIILASGGVAAFSWIGIKSKVFIALLAPYLATKEQILSESLTNGDITEYYSMVFIAIIVGMFASNIVIFIENKTKMLELTAKIKDK
ncbi:TPA: hypothetical protein ACXJEZ_003532 [Providencia rettgeri]